VVDLKTGTIVAVEALLRWRHPTKGLIAPGEFIPLAEDTGLIVQLGEWAMLKACHDAVGMPGRIKVAVNLSPVQFSKSNIVDVTLYALADSMLEPGRLELEITEGVILQESEQNLDILRQLTSVGVSIALDDFGVGYSSLSYLTSFKFNKVKIDKSFIDKIDRPETKAIISSIVQLAHSLNLATVVEGIETEAQLAEIRALGVNYAQGYLFARPAPLADLRLTADYSIGAAKAA
jgi:EAL domain-containing protein (putative c-di-GMP-specific phosphodiesterase class I)